MTEIEEKKELEKVNEIVNNMGNEKETLIASCKLLARLLHEQGKKYNATEIKFTVSDIYELKDYSKWGSIEIKWKIEQQLEIDKQQINYFIEETEKLKKQIKQLEDFIKSDGEIDYINHEYTYKLKEENNKLKYALKEIEETIEHFKKYFSKEELNKVKFGDITTIEQIISEAINDRN